MWCLAAGLTLRFVRALFRTGGAVVGREPPLWLSQASYVVAGAWALGVTWLALRMAARRPVAREGATAAPLGSSRLAGWAALGVLVIGLGAGVNWTARHGERLGPVTRGASAPDFALPRINGKPGQVALADHRGKVVVLDF